MLVAEDKPQIDPFSAAEVDSNDVAAYDKGNDAQVESGQPVPEQAAPIREDIALSDKEYARLMHKAPIQATKKDWAKTGQARMQRYASMDESDIPELDFFPIAEYNKVNMGYIYVVHNYGKDSYTIVQKKQIKPQNKDIANQEERKHERTGNRQRTGQNSLLQRSNEGRSVDGSDPSGHRGELSEDVGRAVPGGEAVQDMADRQVDADRGSGELSEPLTTEQLLQQAMDDMGKRPMNPKTYNALFGYKAQLEQRGRIENLLAQQQEILTRQQSEGATAYDIGKTEANIAQLQKKLAAQKGKLQTAENSPTLQQIAEKTRSCLPQEAAVENSRKNVLDISAKIDTIKAEGKIITDGSHIKNGKLQPNVTYQTGEHAYIYQTNEDGLISKVYVGSLQEKAHDGRLKHNPNTYGKQAGDHAGHLIADRFGGSQELDNLVSQAAVVNLSKYKMVENEWAAALAANKTVSVGITINYENGSARPVSFTVEYVIDGKKVTKTIHNNSAGGKSNG